MYRGLGGVAQRVQARCSVAQGFVQSFGGLLIRWLSRFRRLFGI